MKMDARDRPLKITISVKEVQAMEARTTEHFHTSLDSTTREKIASVFRTLSWSGFWVELILAAISSAILFLAIADPSFNIDTLKSGFGFFSAVCGIIALGFGVYWTFSYLRIAQRLEDFETSNYLSKKEVVKTLENGVIIHLIGMLLILLSAQIIVGVLLLKVLSLPQGLAISQVNRLIEPLDIFVVQASLCAIVAQFIGIAISFWLLKRIGHSYKV
jgi:hypothetical protein